MFEIDFSTDVSNNNISREVNKNILYEKVGTEYLGFEINSGIKAEKQWSNNKETQNSPMFSTIGCYYCGTVVYTSKQDIKTFSSEVDLQLGSVAYIKAIRRNYVLMCRSELSGILE